MIAGGGAAALAARALSSAGVGLAVVAAALCPQGPTLAPGGALAERVQVGRLERAFLLRVPAEASAHPALVLAFHGGGGDGAAMPELVGRSLEPLASEHDFLVAYPDGYAGHWNDCRGRATFPAKRLAVDDVGFVHALVQRLRREHHVDPTRVFALGFSNGGHMAYRLALEMPGEVAAAAAFARSGPQSLEYFSRLDGYAGPPSRTEVVAVERPETMRVERTRWSRPGSPEVVLFTIHGGGHVIPGPHCAFPASAGPCERRFDAVAEAVRFFLAQPHTGLEERDSEGATEPRK